jgi:hypothetical protein
VLTLLLGLGGGAALALVPLFTNARDLMPTLVGGAVIGSVSFLVGIPLASLGDGPVLHWDR